MPNWPSKRANVYLAVCIGAVALSAVVVWRATSTLTNSDSAASPESAFDGVPANALESFGITVKQSAIGDGPPLLGSAQAEAAARNAPTALDAPLRQAGKLAHVTILHRYGTGKAFDGPAWTFSFGTTLPSAASGAPFNSAILLVTVDARTGELLAVNGFEPRQ